MKTLLLILTLASIALADIQLAPDGTFVDGTPQLAPDGTFIGSGQIQIAPNGQFIATDPHPNSFTNTNSYNFSEHDQNVYDDYYNNY